METKCGTQNITELLARDVPGKVRFLGSRAAELFTRELEESFDGVLRKNLYAGFERGNAGFVSASIDGRPWTDTMWSRDTGVFMRELVLWGYLGHACLVADCLMGMVRENEQGFFTFPECFRLGEPASGSELDGTAAIVIALCQLWRRLPDEMSCRARIYQFLHGSGSPVRYVHGVLRKAPLVSGSGEFGGGCGIPGHHLNVVQNALCRWALLAGADFERVAGDEQTAALYGQDAGRIAENMERYLVDAEGAWIWCIDPDTLKPRPEIIDHEINKGFGGLNGVACMSADVLGFAPLDVRWQGADHCIKTFDKLLSFPLRKQQFEKYGLWTQFDAFGGGYYSGPSYGHGYALQTMLLFDYMDMADRAVTYLAEATYRPPRAFPLDRESPYHFYERYISPDGAGVVQWDQGCGALNLVCVAEPLKVARLILGVDDTSSDHVTILPRVPPSWQGYEATDWPIRVGRGVVRATLRYMRDGSRERFRLHVEKGDTIPNLRVRLGKGPDGFVYHTLHHAADVELPEPK